MWYPLSCIPCKSPIRGIRLTTISEVTFSLSRVIHLVLTMETTIIRLLCRLVTIVHRLVDAINANIATLTATSTDVSFGNTSMSLNQQTSRVKLNLGFEKQYNETSYFLNFPNGTAAFALDEDPTQESLNLRRATIPSFLGFEDLSYNLFNIESTKDLPLATDTTNANENKAFLLDSSNNFFTVYKYIGPAEESGVPSNIDLSFNVTLSLTTGVDYVRAQLVDQLITDLSNNI